MPAGNRTKRLAVAILRDFHALFYLLEPYVCGLCWATARSLIANRKFIILIVDFIWICSNVKKAIINVGAKSVIGEALFDIKVLSDKPILLWMDG